MRNPSTSRSSIDKVKRVWREFERNQRVLREYHHKYFCENSPFARHDFQPYQPFVGCFKNVCRFCAQESQHQNLRQSVHAYKGKRFGSEKKTKVDTEIQKTRWSPTRESIRKKLQ